MNITKDTDLLREQTRLTAAKADLAEVKLKLQKGEVVEKKEVLKQWKKNAGTIKTKLLGLPETAPQLYGLEIGEIKAVLTQKVRDILNELAEEYR